jgi:hypothetical protein
MEKDKAVVPIRIAANIFSRRKVEDQQEKA